MRSGIRLPIYAVVAALVLMLVASAAAQIRFEDFSSVANLQLNGSPHQASWQSQNVLRLTDGALSLNGRPQAGTAYFTVQQPLTNGFTTWFEFQMHNPTVCCNPGDGLAFIIQNSTATDPTYGPPVSGAGLTALGAASGGMGYTGINNNLAVEFDIHQDPWDPNASHVAVQSCGQSTNTPVHDDGDYTIGQHEHVPNCLLSSNAIAAVPTMGGTCSGFTCTDGAMHQVFIQYMPPTGHQSMGTLSIWLDNINPATHTPNPGAVPTITVPYNITSLSLNNGAAWVGFTASQPSQGTAQDIFGWEFTIQGPTQITQTIQNGGMPTTFAFGSHQTTVTYPVGFMNNGTQMTVIATPTDRNQFYQTRLLGTGFANEQCIVYQGTNGPTGPLASGNCVVYSYSCQDSMGNQVNCPSEPLCTSPQQSQCIAIDTTFYTNDNVTPTNADYLENDAMGSNNWMSIFLSFMSKPIDGTTSGGSRGFGGGGSSTPSKRKFFTGSADTADIVATFRPGQQ